MRDKVIVILISLISFHAQAQDIEIRSGFVQDSITVGEEVNYWLTATYPESEEVLLPDTNFSFSPFEYLNKFYAPTVILPDGLYDSAVYTLQSFEIDAIQYLELPVIVFQGQDSSIMTSPLDSIFLKELASAVSDTTSLKKNLSYQEVNRQFNFPMLWILIGILIAIALAIFLIFGKRIRRFLAIRKLRNDYLRFSDKQEHYIQKLKEDQGEKLVEEAVTHWKHYLEKLESQPITKLTTSEILDLGFADELKEGLHSIDKCIYGHGESSEIYRSFQSIEDFTQHRYNVKLNELKDGE